MHEGMRSKGLGTKEHTVSALPLTGGRKTYSGKIRDCPMPHSWLFKTRDACKTDCCCKDILADLAAFQGNYRGFRPKTRTVTAKKDNKL